MAEFSVKKFCPVYVVKGVRSLLTDPSFLRHILSQHRQVCPYMCITISRHNVIYMNSGSPSSIFTHLKLIVCC